MEVAPLSAEPQSFHAEETNPKATIFLSPLSVQQYIAAGENIPIDIYFNGSFPCISYRLQNNELIGDVPIKTSELQKHIYLHGQRYIKKWDLKLASGKAQKSTMTYMSIITLILVAIAIGVTWYLCKNRAPAVPVLSAMPQVIQY
jgi:hypothetical protein